MTVGGLRLEGIEFRHPGAAEPVLRSVDLHVLPGEVVAVVGGSGGGKSTLLRVVAGLTRASRGEVWFDGARIDGLEPGRRNVGMVFQDYALYPHLTVRENLAFPLEARGVRRSEIAIAVGQIAERLRLGDFLSRFPRQLSGGQQQRVALGRLLVRSPRVALFDEPLSNLDVSLRRELRVEIRRLQRENGWTSLYVTHDPVEAASVGDRVAVLAGGRVVQVAPLADLRISPSHRECLALLAAEPTNFAVAANLPRSWWPSGAESTDEIAWSASSLEAVAVERGELAGECLGPASGPGDRFVAVSMAWGRQWVVCSGSLGDEAGRRVEIRRRPEVRPFVFDGTTGHRRPVPR
jgi:ABC-type sugar transport system ATPase subunit